MSDPSERPDYDPNAPMVRLVYDTFERMAEFHSGGSRPLFGLRDLDALVCVTDEAQLILLVGRPGMGRSALSLHLAAAQPDRAVLYFSVNQTAAQTTQRLLAASGRADQSRIRAGQLSERDWERLAHAAGRLSEQPLHIIDAYDFTVERMLSATRETHAAIPLSLVVIDGLELLNALPGEAMDAALLRLRVLSRDLGCPVVVTLPLSSKLEQRPYPRKRPWLTDIDVSPRAAEIADVVLGLYRDEMYNRGTDQSGIAEIIVMKQSDGPVGTVRVQFHTPHGRFNDLAPEGI